ncbi:MAG: putative baseplate assembly protein [Roseiflexaceae bacterium]
MPLPTPNLDDRHFQDIVDQAKRMIPQYCREWTDHNVSDPGVTLIELFAWMTDMLLYRVNQVPDKMYIKFLEMLGMQLEAPRAARVPVTFYFSAAQPIDVTIPADTEVATIRTETEQAIIFTTEEALTVRPAQVTGVYTRDADRRDITAWTTYDLRQLGLTVDRIPIFPNQPAPDDAFYLHFTTDHSNHVLALLLVCEEAAGAGIDPTNPPFVWEAYQGGPVPWGLCTMEKDETGGFCLPSAPGEFREIVLRTPHMEPVEIEGVGGFWLRCRLTLAQSGPQGYRVTPNIKQIEAEARGGTAYARHGVSQFSEVIGRSEGVPGQTFKLLQTPLLARDPNRDFLMVELPDGSVQHWQEVSDFADSTKESLHYTLDSLDGTLSFGPMLIQPDGTVFNYGAVPPKDALLRFSRYQHGGGRQGNVPSGAISVLKTSIPYVARVINHERALGGLDAQTVEDARIRIPKMLRTRSRAVTADDYEYLAAHEIPDVARAHCLSPGAQPGDPSLPPPGQVAILVLPKIYTQPGRRISDEQLALSAELRDAVLSSLSKYSMVGTRLDVRAPRIIRVNVQARLRLAEGSNPLLVAEVQRKAEEALYRYLDPYVGGSRGDGWPFGRTLHQSELYSLLQRIPAVEFVEALQIYSREMGDSGPMKPVQTKLAIPRDAVVCADQHQVIILQ